MRLSRVARITTVLVVSDLAIAGCGGSSSHGGNTGNPATTNTSNTATSTLTVTSTLTETTPANTSSTTPGGDGGTGNTGAGNTGGGSEGPGSYTHAGDEGFCATHQCIANFPNGRGYVVQCNDGDWSHSGGLSGACSDHGGEMPGVNTGNTGTGNTGLTPGDQNPNDASAANCDATMQIGPHADCYLAQQVASDLAKGLWSAPGSDTVTEGSNTITFDCSITRNAGGASQAPVYTCISTHDSQDWFKFEFT